MTEPKIHIYTAKPQPATNFVDRSMFRPRRVRWPAHRVFTCARCRRRRYAKNCRVQVYYDEIRVTCKEHWERANG